MSHPWPQNPSPSSSSEHTHADGEEDSSDRSTTPNNSQEHYGQQFFMTPRSPTSASTPGVDAPLLHDQQPRPPARSLSSGGFISSPLNPNPHSPTPAPLPTGSTPASPGAGSQSPFARSRPQSRTSTFNRLPSEETQALASQFSSSSLGGARGSMLLYRLAAEDDHTSLLPPRGSFATGANPRDSFASSSGDSVFSLSSDSKYPIGSSRGLVPYAYDPALDEKEAPDEEDALHDPEYVGKGRASGTGGWGLRGIMNVGLLLILIAGLLCLFILYPVITFLRNNARNLAIDGNIHINGTGQNPVLFQMPQLIDTDTPDSAKSRTGYDGNDYELVFSDEFNVDGRTFYPGDDPFWEAVDLWYWATNDQEWYDPGQITTKNGSLVITMESVATNGLPYRSGMLQSWNKFCFSSGYIEVSVTMPGPDQNTQGYWPGAWTMGNLGRPGYGGTTDGMWPYSYSSCDVGTFPNQTLKDHSGPAAALHTNAGRDKYNFELSWLSGQRLSACTCPGEDHPGPDVTVGRGAPEIDILEVERNKAGDGQVVSQSSQFAPFTADYNFLNATPDEWTIYDPTITRVNSYKGSAVQQAVSGLTQLPVDMFQGSGQQFKTFGFEYWGDPNDIPNTYITWVSDGKQSARMGSAAVGPDQGTDGSGVGQRLISQEPMSIVLNLGISSNWQTIDLSTMIFPATMLVDYVRVYQRKGKTNIGCDPKDFPTADYINRHMNYYTNPLIQTWNTTKPKNRLYDGC